MEICTIGFTQRSARQFFEILKANHIRGLIDVRLNNAGQLAGFTKRADLEYFLDVICGASYVHEPRLAPTQELLSDYRAGRCTWSDYERAFNQLMSDRQVECTIDRTLFNEPAVLLCSEPTPEQCHRRLVAEYLQQHWPDIHVRHL